MTLPKVGKCWSGCSFPYCCCGHTHYGIVDGKRVTSMSADCRCSCHGHKTRVSSWAWRVKLPENKSGY